MQLMLTWQVAKYWLQIYYKINLINDSLGTNNGLKNNSVHLQPIKGAITDAYIMVHQ
jgi:hypothetical protein